MTFTTKTLLILEHTVRTALLLVKLAFLLAIVFGLPSATGYLAWFTRQRLPPQQSVNSQSKEEVFACLIFHTLFLTVVIWGAVPYYNIRTNLPPWLCSCASAVVHQLSIAYAFSSGWTILSMRGWAAAFESTGLVGVAMHCHAAAIFLSGLLVLGCWLKIVLLSFEIFGLPIIVERILLDTKNTLGHIFLANSFRRKSDDAMIEKV